MDRKKIKVGDDLILVGGGYSRVRSLAKVERLTKTQIITTKGERFNRNTWYGVGSMSRLSILKIATQEDICEMETNRKISSLPYQVRSIADVDSKTLLTNLDDIIEAATELRELVADKEEK